MEGFCLKINNGMKIILHEDTLQIVKNNVIIIKDDYRNFILLYKKINNVLLTKTLNLIFSHPSYKNSFQISINNSDKKWNDALYFSDNIADVYFKKDIQSNIWKASNFAHTEYQPNKNNDKPVDLPVKKNQVKSYEEFYSNVLKIPGFYVLGVKKEIKYLYDTLLGNEGIYAIVSGYMNGNSLIIVCTDKRILFVDSGIVYGVKHSEVMLEKINSVSYKNGLLSGEISIQDGATIKTILNVAKGSTKIFVDSVHRAIENLKQVHQQNIYSQQISVADEIKKFKQLLDAGVITQDEFDIQKKKLLNM